MGVLLVDEVKQIYEEDEEALKDVSFKQLVQDSATLKQVQVELNTAKQEMEQKDVLLEVKNLENEALKKELEEEKQQ